MSNPLPGAITTEHRYFIPVPREDVWSLISDVNAYRSWWPWLRRFAANGLIEGDVWRCEVQPPLPYIVRFTVTIEDVQAPKILRAAVAGDVVGTARLQFDEEGDGCVARLSSTLAPGNTALRLVSRVAAPLARFGHDWVLDSGARQFIARSVRAAEAGEQ